MASLQKTLSGGATLTLIALVLAVVAYATDYWARYSNNWEEGEEGVCNVDYKFNWGLYRYDSTSKLTCNDVVWYKIELKNYELDCDVVDDDNCDNLHDAQRASVATLVFAILTLCAFTILAARSFVNMPLLITASVLALIQMICAFIAVGAYSGIVANYSRLIVEYPNGDVYYYDVNIHTGFSWALMLVSSLLAVAEVGTGVSTLYQAKLHLAEMHEPLA